MKNMFCSNFHFKLKRKLADKSDEEIDDIDDLFYSPYKKWKLNEEEDIASTIVAVTANTVCNFQSMKSPVELNSLLSEFFCYITWFVISPD